MHLASTIDHTRLGADTRVEHIGQLCSEALTYGFAAVCVPPIFVEEATELLKGSKVAVATVVGFPLGYQLTDVKVEEARQALQQGATEIDMVIQQGAVQAGNWEFVKADIAAVQFEVKRIPGALLKVIIESCNLNDSQLQQLCEILGDLNVDFAKTSTGFAKEGANIAVVTQMRAILPKSVRIKASGGIRTKEFALNLIAAGADRIGTSSGVELVQP